jgi:hypothetical protein
MRLRTTRIISPVVRLPHLIFRPLDFCDTDCTNEMMTNTGGGVVVDTGDY